MFVQGLEFLEVLVHFPELVGVSDELLFGFHRNKLQSFLFLLLLQLLHANEHLPSDVVGGFLHVLYLLFVEFVLLRQLVSKSLLPLVQLSRRLFTQLRQPLLQVFALVHLLTPVFPNRELLLVKLLV